MDGRKLDLFYSDIKRRFTGCPFRLPDDGAQSVCKFEYSNIPQKHNMNIFTVATECMQPARHKKKRKGAARDEQAVWYVNTTLLTSRL